MDEVFQRLSQIKQNAQRPSLDELINEQVLIKNKLALLKEELKIIKEIPIEKIAKRETLSEINKKLKAPIINEENTSKDFSRSIDRYIK